MTRLSNLYGKDYRLSVVVPSSDERVAFAKAGITTTIGLLEKCRTTRQAGELAAKLDMSLDGIERLVSICDLMRVRGIGLVHAAALVDAADISELSQLRCADPKGLQSRMKAAGSSNIPTVRMLRSWKEQAAAIPLLAEVEPSDAWVRQSLATTAKFSLRFMLSLWSLIVVIGAAAYLFTRYRVGAAAQLAAATPSLIPALRQFVTTLYDRFILAFVSMASGIGLFLLIPVPLLQRIWMLSVDNWARFREKAEYFHLLRFLEARGSIWDKKVMRWTMAIAVLIAVSILIVALSFPIPDITPYLDSLADGQGAGFEIPGALLLLTLALSVAGVLPSVLRLRAYPGRKSPAVVRFYMRRTAMKDLSTLLVVLVGLVLALEVGQRVSQCVADNHYRPQVEAAAEELLVAVDESRAEDSGITDQELADMTERLDVELEAWSGYLDEGWRALSIAVRIVGALLVMVVAFLIVFEQLAMMVLFLLRRRRAMYLLAFIVCSIVIPVAAELYLGKLLPFENISWIVAAGSLGVGLVSGMLMTEGDAEREE